MELKSFDEYLYAQLRDPEFATLYLNEAYADSIDEFLVALNKYVQANKVNSEALSALLPNAQNPELRSIQTVLQSLGFSFAIGRLSDELNKKIQHTDQSKVIAKAA